MAYVALFVALGGTSYGLASGSIDSREIRNNTVRSKDIRNNEVRSRDVRNGSLLERDFAPGQLPAGQQGAQGPQGVQGPAGGFDPAKVVVRTGGTATAGANGSGNGCTDGTPGGSKGVTLNNALVPCGGGAGGASTSTASCLPGEVATGGGHTFAAGKRHALVAESAPTPNVAGQRPTGWRVKVETLTNDSTNDTPVTPWVICARR